MTTKYKLEDFKEWGEKKDKWTANLLKGLFVVAGDRLEEDWENITESWIKPNWINDIYWQELKKWKAEVEMIQELPLLNLENIVDRKCPVCQKEFNEGKQAACKNCRNADGSWTSLNGRWHAPVSYADRCLEKSPLETEDADAIKSFKNNNMSNCQRCQTEITNGNFFYGLQRESWEEEIFVCEPCFENNEVQFIIENNFITKFGDDILPLTIKEPKPKVDGQETNYFECEKCHITLSITISDIDSINDCPYCQSKDFELNLIFPITNEKLHCKTKECPQCHKAGIDDLLEWPINDEIRGKSKSEVIKFFSRGDDDVCHCSDNDDNRNNGEEEEVTKVGTKQTGGKEPPAPPSSGGFSGKNWLVGLVLAALIGSLAGGIIYVFWGKKKKR